MDSFLSAALLADPASLCRACTMHSAVSRLWMWPLGPRAPTPPGFPSPGRMSPFAICNRERNQFPRWPLCVTPGPLVGVWKAVPLAPSRLDGCSQSDTGGGGRSRVSRVCREIRPSNPLHADAEVQGTPAQQDKPMPTPPEPTPQPPAESRRSAPARSGHLRIPASWLLLS